MVISLYKTPQENAEGLLEIAKQDVFGTPEHPNRMSGGKGVFWLVYHQQRKAEEYKGSFSYPWALAGDLYREYLQKEEKEYLQKSAEEYDAIATMIKRAQEQGLLIEVVRQFASEAKSEDDLRKAAFHALSEWDC